MAKRPTKNQGTRRGGPNPGARARKELEGLPALHLVDAAKRGRFDKAIEGVGFAIAVVREFKRRLESASPDDATALNAAVQCDVHATGLAENTWEVAAGEARLNSPTTAGEVTAKNISNLGIWLAAATPEKLRALANILEARPIMPSPLLCGNLCLAPADPVLAAIGMAVALTPPGEMHTAISVEGMRSTFERATPGEIERFREKYCPSVDSTTFRKALNEFLGVKRPPGKPKA